MFKTSTFTRLCWFLPERSNILLVQYVGDYTEYIPTKYGNSKHEREYIRTAPSVHAEIKNNLHAKPKEIEMKSKSDVVIPEHVPVLRIRNRKQIYNHVANKNLFQRFSKDEIFNTMIIATELSENFMANELTPELFIIYAHLDCVTEFTKLLKTYKGTIVLYYDTTFKLGDFYVSPLIYRHALLVGEPCFPLVFLIHRRKIKEVHMNFFFRVSNRIHLMQDVTNIVIITDREEAITSSIKKVMPNVKLLYCWNHIRKDIKRWLYTKNYNQNDIFKYSRCVINLLNASDNDEFEKMYDVLKSQTNGVFIKYITKMLPDLKAHACRIQFQHLNIINTYNGITNNGSESLNCVLKRLMNWREVPIDTLLLALDQLQAHFQYQVLSAICDTGDYHLKQEYRALLQDPSQINFPPNVKTPSQIFEDMCSG